MIATAARRTTPFSGLCQLFLVLGPVVYFARPAPGMIGQAVSHFWTLVEMLCRHTSMTSW